MYRTLVVRSFVVTVVTSSAPSTGYADELIVSAAASLNNAFKEIAQAYETKHAGSKVSLNLGASGASLQQMTKGALVDVFASAD